MSEPSVPPPESTPPPVGGNGGNSTTLEIQDLAFGGDGVARVDGKVWFVPWTIPGEIVRARPIRQKKDFVRAELLEVLQPSPKRTTPSCPHFSICGGCRYQHLDYSAQLEIKRKQVADVLARVGRLADVPVDEVVASPSPYHYRNRITLHIVDGIAGFHRADGRGILEIESCAIADEEVNQRLESFRQRDLYDGHRTLRSYDDPAGFRQTNDAVAVLLAQTVHEWLSAGGPWLIDAYCGSGFFAHDLRSIFQEVIGIDWSEGAIAAAERRALPRESYLQADVGEILPDLLRQRLEDHNAPGAVLLDPPAEGLPTDVLGALLETPVRDLIYVSCHPATFARDAARLAPVYELLRVTPFDMFPQTAEIELAARFQLRTNSPAPVS